ncbi:MAG: nitronate monooxygenase [Bdellovibrionaceae bacterium]|nr:nitronate monooxygenase [Pseudobdellovibrionaceae bacterium]
MISEIKTPFTQLVNCKLPIIGAPMFLVSTPEMVVAVSEAGGVGSIPSLNFRPAEEFEKQVKAIRAKTEKPIGVNLIVNKSNQRQKPDLKASLDAGVDLFITSLGSPKEVIKEAHKNGAKVICDVVNLEHAKKVEDLGADGVVAVCAGAGGHAGELNPFVFIPWLKANVNIPIIAAGGIADGYSMAAALTLGASAVHVGTRFIASTEAQVNMGYKNAILKSTPEDIVLTAAVSGTPCTFINTPSVKKMGDDIPFLLKTLKKHPLGKKLVVPLVHLLGMKKLEQSANQYGKSDIWCAGQSVGVINEVLDSKAIVEKFIAEYELAVKNTPQSS